MQLVDGGTRCQTLDVHTRTPYCLVWLSSLWWRASEQEVRCWIVPAALYAVTLPPASPRPTSGARPARPCSAAIGSGLPVTLRIDVANGAFTLRAFVRLAGANL